jgi:hypothetical protein
MRDRADWMRQDAPQKQLKAGLLGKIRPAGKKYKGEKGTMPGIA